MSFVRLLLDAANADAARERALDERLDRLVRAVEDQGAMLLELAEAVRALTAAPAAERVAAAVAGRVADTLAALPPFTTGDELSPADPVAATLAAMPSFTTQDVLPPAREPAPPPEFPPEEPSDAYVLLQRYRDERETNYQTLAAELGWSPKRVTETVEREARRLGPSMTNELRKAANSKKGYKAQQRNRAAQQLLGRTDPPAARFSTVPLSQIRQ